MEIIFLVGIGILTATLLLLLMGVAILVPLVIGKLVLQLVVRRQSVVTPPFPIPTPTRPAVIAIAPPVRSQKRSSTRGENGLFTEAELKLLRSRRS